MFATFESANFPPAPPLLIENFYLLVANDDKSLLT